jgi:hypothetical protein
VPPGWSGAIPANVVRVDAPTPYVWIIGRTKTDEPILAQMRWIGIERSKSFDLDKLDPATKTALETAPKDALALIAWRVSSLARVVNGWSMNTDTMGAYGDYYLEARDRHPAGLGANVPKDAIYPINLADDTGSRWMAPIAMSCISKAAPFRQSMPSGRSRSMTPRATRCPTASAGSPSAAGCRSNTTRTAPSTSISRTQAPAPTRKQTGCRRQKARSTSPCVSMRQRATR